MLFPFLFAGFLLGLTHAIEADHVAAVSTIATRFKSVKKASKIGLLWGVGHTLTLLIAGIFVLAFKLTIPAKVSLLFEFGVGIMLLVLGARVIFRVKKERYHLHTHLHDELKHTHFHSHQKSASHRHEHASFFVGLLHGLAGSGALMLVILAGAPTLITGIMYIIAFGIGSTLAMAAVSGLISCPLRLTRLMPRSAGYVAVLSGLASIGVGATLVFAVGTIFL